MVWEFLGSEPQFAKPSARPVGAVPCSAAKWVSDPNNSNLRCSPKTGSRSNSASPQTIASPDPLLPALLGPARRVVGMNTKADTGRHDARSAPCRSQAAVMFARGSSTRGQMKSPSIAQRGEGGARGGSGELRRLSTADNRRSVTLPGRLRRLSCQQKTVLRTRRSLQCRQPYALR